MGQILAFASGEQLSPPNVLAELSKILPPYMLPKRLTVLDTLPKNANGKIDRVALQAANQNPSTVD